MNRLRASRCGAPVLAVLSLLACQPQSTGASASQAAHRHGDMSRYAMNRTDKGPQDHNFTEIYDHILFPLRDQEIRILEIGIADGGSLLMWQDYFPKASIDAIDIKNKKKFENDRVRTHIADQADRSKLASVIETAGSGFDFILDDGGHDMDMQQISLGYLFPHVKPGGYYILEDVHTSLHEVWPNFGAEPDESNTTLHMIDAFLRTRKIDSQYMTAEEREYCAENIEYANLFFRNDDHHSMTAIFKKRVGERR